MFSNIDDFYRLNGLQLTKYRQVVERAKLSPIFFDKHYAIILETYIYFMPISHFVTIAACKFDK